MKEQYERDDITVGRHLLQSPHIYSSKIIIIIITSFCS